MKTLVAINETLLKETMKRSKAPTMKETICQVPDDCIAPRSSTLFLARRALTALRQFQEKETL